MVFGRGIVGTLKLAATLTLAIPVGLMGTQFLFGGQSVLGAAFLGIAVLMVAVEEYLAAPTPGDVAGEAAKKAAGAVVERPDDENRE